MADFTLTARTRETRGKGAARKLRSAGGPFAYLSFHARRPCLAPEA